MSSGLTPEARSVRHARRTFVEFPCQKTKEIVIKVLKNKSKFHNELWFTGMTNISIYSKLPPEILFAGTSDTACCSMIKHYPVLVKNFSLRNLARKYLPKS